MPTNISPPASPVAPVPTGTAPAVSPVTGSALPTEASSAVVTSTTSSDEIDRGAAGLENPFRIITVDGKKFPVWKDSGRVPLVAIRDLNGHMAGDAFGAEPEAAQRAINAKEAVLDVRCRKLVGSGDLVPTANPVKVAGDGRDERGDPLDSDVLTTKRGEEKKLAGDGRDANGNVVERDADGVVIDATPPTWPGKGEPLPSGSGPQPAKTNPPDSRVNTAPEAKVIPRPEDVGVDRAKVLDETARDPAQRPNETAARIPGGALKSPTPDEHAAAKDKERGLEDPDTTSKHGAARGKPSGRDA